MSVEDMSEKEKAFTRIAASRVSADAAKDAAA